MPSPYMPRSFLRYFAEDDLPLPLKGPVADINAVTGDFDVSIVNGKSRCVITRDQARRFHAALARARAIELLVVKDLLTAELDRVNAELERLTPTNDHTE